MKDFIFRWPCISVTHFSNIFIYFNSLHVSSNPVFIIRRIELYQYIIWYISLCVGGCLVCRSLRTGIPGSQEVMMGLCRNCNTLLYIKYFIVVGGKIPPQPSQTADLPSFVTRLQSYFPRGLHCTRTRILQALAARYTSNNSKLVILFNWFLQLHRKNCALRQSLLQDTNDFLTYLSRNSNQASVWTDEW
jgi:hypothetical protein